MEQKKSTQIKTVEKNGRVRVQTLHNTPSKTQQHFQEHVNVNNIIRKYKKTGQLPELRIGHSLDLTSVTDYQGAMNQVIKAQEAFLQLPAEIRKKFNNDPQQIIEFLQNPKNHEESISLGLRVKKEESSTDRVIKNLNTINETLKTTNVNKKQKITVEE